MTEENIDIEDSEATELPPEYYTSEEYFDKNSGKQIKVLSEITLLSGNEVSKTGKKILIGSAMGYNQTGEPVPFTFPFSDGTDLKSAFESFEEVANAAIELSRNEAESQILVPGKDFNV
jgi:hypothetical protein